jgi:hypothetical protein
MNTAFGKFAVLVVLAILAVAVAAWSYRQLTESKVRLREAEQIDKSVEGFGKLIDVAQSNNPKKPEISPKPLAEYSDSERNALWWRIAVECRSDNDVLPHQHSIDTYKVRPLANELQIPFGDLLSFWRSGETAAWRTIENPANSAQQPELK